MTDLAPAIPTTLAPDERRGHAQGETDAMVAELEKAEFVEVYTRPDGQVIYRLTEQGVRVGRMLAMAEGSKAGLVLDARLDAHEDG